MNGMTTVQVAQLSDTHFLEDGEVPEGGHAYDTDEAFDSILEHLGDHAHLDLIAVTGDVADHGRPAQYRKAADAFARLQAPVVVCPGNHDFDDAFHAGIGRPGVGTARVVEVESWAFVFVDSSAGVMQPDASGRLIDPDDGNRIHNNGVLGSQEAARVRAMHDAVDAEHVFIWLHHPPDPTIALPHDPSYAEEWRSLLPYLPRVRGFGGGHTHVPTQYELLGLPVFVAPSLKNNFSMEPQTWLPPGYRTFDFHPDGAIESTVHLVDDDRWPRRPFGRALKSLFDGELSYAELAEITARKAR